MGAELITASEITTKRDFIMTGNDRDHRDSRRKGDSKMAAQSQGIKQLMAAEKDAARVVADARKSK